MLAFTVCEILIFLNVDFENIGHGHVVEKLDLSHSLANINLCKSRT